MKKKSFKSEIIIIIKTKWKIKQKGKFTLSERSKLKFVLFLLHFNLIIIDFEIYYKSFNFS